MPRLFAALAAALAVLSSASPAPAAVQLPDVCATVDGEPITRDELLRAFDALVLSTGKTPSEMKDEVRLDGYRTVLNEMINDRLIGRLSKDIVVTEADVKARFEQVKRDFAPRGTDGEREEAFREGLAKAGLTESTLMENLRSSIRQERWMASKMESEVNATEDEIKAAYELNKDHFTTPLTLRASHIVFQILPGMTPAEMAAKKKAADDAAAKIIAAKGANFPQLARELSEDTATKERGGDLGWFTTGSIDQDLEKALLKIKVGDITAPLKTKIGYHLLQKTGERPPELTPLEKVRERLRELVLQGKRKVALQKLLTDLRSKAKIEIKLPAN